MDNLLNEIRKQIDNDNRPPDQIYAMVKNIGAQMFFTRTMSKDGVIAMCAGLLKLYDILPKPQARQA